MLWRDFAPSGVAIGAGLGCHLALLVQQAARAAPCVCEAVNNDGGIARLFKGADSLAVFRDAVGLFQRDHVIICDFGIKIGAAIFRINHANLAANACRQFDCRHGFS
jgi:hypothetical protein